MPQQKKRSKNHEITIQYRGVKRYISLRWTHEKVRYRLPLGLPASPLSIETARVKIREIERSINRDEFDPTLEAYKPKPEAPTEEQTKPSALGELFAQYIKSRTYEGTSEQTISSKYKPLASRIAKFEGDPLTKQGAIELVASLRLEQSKRIANQNLTLLRSCVTWAIEEGLVIAGNPYKRIKPLKLGYLEGKRADHFSLQEVELFLEAVLKHPIYRHYHDYCYVLFYMGLRPSEAIGLRWKHLDREKRTLAIVERLARGPKGQTSGKARQRLAGTKNGTVRTMKLNERLFAMFEGRFKKAAPTDLDDLIFPSPRGTAIDDKNFASRCWTDTCRAAGLVNEDGKPRCPPYSARHGFARRLLEATKSAHQTSVALGNSPKTVMTNYGNNNDMPDIPDF